MKIWIWTNKSTFTFGLTQDRSGDNHQEWNDLDCRHQTLPGEILCFYVVVTVSCSQHYVCSHGRRCWFWGLLLCSLYAFHVRVGFNVHQFWDNLNTAELQRRSLSVFCVFSWVQPTRRLLPLQNKHEAFRFQILRRLISMATSQHVGQV